MQPIIGGKFIFFVGVGTILYGIAKLVEHEINYRNNMEKTVNELKHDCSKMKEELELANNVINDYKA